MFKVLFSKCKQYRIVRRKQTVDLAVTNSGTFVDLGVTVYSTHKDFAE